ncbi:hypothetical protein Raf01_52780 [Rugosimonospora africana]|uniref:Uncharacterized protein n=1 Tax=Rugosimonospora africana TaxID=556532 RepID=A0A8J3QYQ9_9ACTN|nr:hypothetical protein Raf01_52780 [Rugosimonospora africana]
MTNPTACDGCERHHPVAVAPLDVTLSWVRFGPTTGLVVWLGRPDSESTVGYRKYFGYQKY